MFTGCGGGPHRRYQMDKRPEEGTTVPEGEAAWASAEPAEQGERWQEENALVSAPGSHMILPGETVALPAPWGGASAHVEISRDRCPLARLLVALGGQSKAFPASW